MQLYYRFNTKTHSAKQLLPYSSIQKGTIIKVLVLRVLRVLRVTPLNSIE